MAEHSPSITELNFYPVKSLRGLRTNELHLDQSGALYDRQWMIVDDKGTFLTQRQMPEMATIGVTFEDGILELSKGEHGTIDFGLEEVEGPEIKVKCWQHEMPAFEVSSEVSKWVSEVLKKPLRLVRMSSSSNRLYDPADPKTTLRFVDQRPLLVISKESLELLEAKAKMQMSMARFRPNIVISHVPAHAEDNYAGFSAGGLEFKALKPSTRCKITCTHPLTGVVGDEPLKTLATYRRAEKGITFGYYYANLKPGVLKLGAPVSPH